MSDLKKIGALVLLFFVGWLLYLKFSKFQNDYMKATKKDKELLEFVCMTVPIERYYKIPRSKYKKEIHFFDGSIAKIGKAFRIREDILVIYLCIINKTKSRVDIDYEYAFVSFFVKGSNLNLKEVDERELNGLKLLKKGLFDPGKTMCGFLAFRVPVKAKEFILYNRKDENYITSRMADPYLTIKYAKKQKRLIKCKRRIYSVEEVIKEISQN